MFICLDVESTGLNPKKDHLIEVAIVHFDHEKILEEWSSLIKPPIPIPEFTKRLTGINDEMVSKAPAINEILGIIKEKCGNHPIMGHFIFFDINFLRENGLHLENLALDTCQLTQSLLHNEASYSLEVLVEKLGLQQPNAHRALDDVKANIELFWRLSDHIRALSNREKEVIKTILQKSDWNWAAIILSILEEIGGKRIYPSERKKSISNTVGINIKRTEPPFLMENAKITYQDLINYSLNLEGSVLLSVPDVNLLPPHPNLGILKHPNNYLDEDRLALYLQKEKLTQKQSLLGIKLSLWANTTIDGSKSTLRLVKDEKEDWFHVCGQEGMPRSFYKKALNKAMNKKIIAIDHHYFLKDRSRKNPLISQRNHIVLGETEALVSELQKTWHIRLSENSFLSDIRRLKQENPKSEEILNHIAAKLSIFYGFIGMELQRYEGSNDPRHPIIIEGHHRNTPEWNRVMKAAASIQSAVAALGNNLNQGPTLDAFEKQIKFLHKIMSVQGPLLWLAKSQDGMPLIHSFPQNTAQIFKERIWNTNSALHLFARNANMDDDFAFIRKELNLNSSFKYITDEYKTSIPIIYPKKAMPHPSDPGNIPYCIHEIAKEMPNAGNIIVLVNSMTVAKQFFYKFTEKVLESGRKLFVQNMSGGLGKIVKMSEKTDGKNIFVGNEAMLKKLLSEDIKLQMMAVHKLPFSHPDSPIQKARSRHYKNIYKEFSLPAAKLRHARNINAFLGNDRKNKRILMLDPRAQNLF